TEAAHQMCCNPLEPDRQKPGAVGLPAGPEVRIAHEIENRLVMGIGEIAISGPNVTPGYEGNPEANAKNFFEAEGKRWFRTGDQGAFDAEGYLTLTGRLKELINRGGEKVSPLEVDGVLSAHPAVAQALTFAMPHAKLGEEVAAAVVLREGAACTERELRDFAAQQLADFKVPRKVVFLPEIPKGATGKLMRIGLAEKLGLSA
ncbi:MAG: AMP-binding enzyme, partial [Alphaproteobacteria bacterium]